MTYYAFDDMSMLAACEVKLRYGHACERNSVIGIHHDDREMEPGATPVAVAGNAPASRGVGAHRR